MAVFVNNPAAGAIKYALRTIGFLMGSGDTSFPSPSAHDKDLSQAKRDVDSLECTREDLSFLLQETTTSLREAKLRYARLNNQKAAISILPMDILSMIFEALQMEIKQVNPTTKTPTLIDRTTELMEMNVSQVCCRWRAVALSTPSLWNTIYAFSNKPPEEIAAYLLRSGKYPLDLRFDCYRADVGRLRTEPSMLDMIIPHVGRWKRLFMFSMDANDFSKVLIRIHHLSAPILEHLSISLGPLPFTPRTFEDEDAYPQIFACGLPSLSVVRLGGTGIRFDGSTVTTLHLWDVGLVKMSHSMFRRIIAATPRLTTLYIGEEVVAPRFSADDSTIVMPNLRSLWIDIGGTHFASEMLLDISAPQLECLHLSRPVNQYLQLFLEIQPPFGATPEIKFSTLRTLIISSPGFPEWTYRRLFRVFPNITNLTFRHLPAHFCTAFTNGDEDAVSTSTFEPVPWPYLQSLSVFNVTPDQESRLIEMTLIRKVIRQLPIPKVCLDNDSLLRMNDPDWLREYTELEVVEFPEWFKTSYPPRISGNDDW